MKTQTVYKVVYCSKTTGSFLSCSLSYYIIYKIGDISVPTIGKIFVFDSLENATDFWSSSDKYVVLEGIGTNPIKPKLVCNTPCSSDIFHFWKMRKNKKTMTGTFSTKPITGTLFVDSFTPVKIVKGIRKQQEGN